MEHQALVGPRVRLRPPLERDVARLVAIRRTPEVRRWWRGDDLEREVREDLAEDETTVLGVEVDGSVVGQVQ